MSTDPNLIVARRAIQSVAEDDFANQTWDLCQPVAIDRYWSGERAVQSRQAEARICWSIEALHVRFVCSQQEPPIVSADPKTDRKTLGLWERDVCEIFLAPDPANLSRYFEFEAAPTGEWVDLAITQTSSGRETEWDFDSGITTAAQLEQNRMLIGMRIPWSTAIPKPEPGDTWRVNLFRCVGPESPERYLAWLPTRTPQPNFHLPEAFGTLVFDRIT